MWILAAKLPNSDFNFAVSLPIRTVSEAKSENGGMRTTLRLKSALKISHERWGKTSSQALLNAGVGGTERGGMQHLCGKSMRARALHK